MEGLKRDGIVYSSISSSQALSHLCLFLVWCVLFPVIVGLGDPSPSEFGLIHSKRNMVLVVACRSRLEI